MVRKATIEDAERHNIPTNYCLENWDPTEQPIILRGSVFDVMSFGKWTLEWSLHVHGEGSPSTHIAWDLWILLIDLASKVKQSEDFVYQYSKTQHSRRKDKVIRMMFGFAESGKQLMGDLEQLLKDCEERMLETLGPQALQLGEFPGDEFVRVFLSRNEYLGRTEDFMKDLRRWITDWNER